MGWLKRLFGGGSRDTGGVTPLVFVDRATKLKVVARRAANYQLNGAVLLLSPFEASLEEARQLLEGEGVELDTRSLAEDLIRYPRTGQVVVESSWKLTAGSHHSDGSVPVRVLLVDRYPRIGAHEQLLDSLRSCHPQPRVEIYWGLDEPLFRHFSEGQRIPELLGRLGMEGEEPIEGRMVGGAIDRALRQLEQSAFGDQPADSLEQWFELNVPPR